MGMITAASSRGRRAASVPPLLPLLLLPVLCIAALALLTPVPVHAAALHKSGGRSDVLEALLAASSAASPDFYDLCDQVSALGITACEHHAVATADGFLLDVVRLPTTNGTKRPVLLQHGLFDSAVAFIANARRYQNLGSILAQYGYDVWLPNSRGNHYSMNNTNYAPFTNKTRDAAFWEAIDCDAMAQHDLPALVDYVLAATGQRQLTYVGHSQGTWSAFAAFSSIRPEYAAKVNLLVAFGPVVFMGNATTPDARSLIPTVEQAIADLQRAGVHEVLSEDATLRELAKLCPALGNFCPALINAVVGRGNVSFLNTSQLPVMLRYTPGGSSLGNLLHWLQMVRTGVFGARNFGPAGNMRHYNSTSAPRYNVSAMRGPPTVLVAGLDDSLADPRDVSMLAAALEQAGLLRDVLWLPDYNHLDLIWAATAYHTTYGKIVPMINRAWGL